MTVTVNAPGGVTLNFPDGTDAEAIRGILAKHFGAPAETKSPSMAQGLTRAFSEGVPLLGGILNKADAATDAALAPLMNPMFDEKEQLKGDFGQRYKQALATQEGMSEGFASEHPIASTAANIAGGVASTGALAATGVGAKLLGFGAKSLPGAVGLGAASGAAINAADDVIRNTSIDEKGVHPGGDPIWSGIVGGALGGAAPVIGAGISKAVAPWMRAAEAAKAPETEAARQIFEAGTKDAGKGLTPAQIQEAISRDQPIALMDVGGTGQGSGKATQRLARYAANVSPEAQEALEGSISTRFLNQNDRAAEFLQGMSEFGGDAHELDKALTASMRATDRPAYAKAYAEGGRIWSDELAQASQAPVVQDAIRKTMVSAKNDAAKMGFAAPKNPFRTDENGRIFLGKDERGNTLVPSLQFWDYVKRNLDKLATPEAREWAKAIREHIDTIVPEYAVARGGHAKFMGATNAIQFGRDAVTAGTKASSADNRVLRDSLSKMSDAERKLTREGSLDKMAQILLGKDDGANILKQIDNNPKARERMLLLLGKDKYDQLSSFLLAERLMHRMVGAMGGSTTARQVGDMAEHSVIPKIPPLGLREMLSDALSRAAKKMGMGIDERVARKMGEMLASPTGSEYAKALRMISGNKRLLGAIKIANEDIAPVAIRGAGQGYESGKRPRGPRVTISDN